MPDTDYHSPLCGEERVHMVQGGKVCEGDITEELKEVNRQRVQTEMREGKAHTQHLMEMLDNNNNKVWRHGVMWGRALCMRYKVRAMPDPMPTMKHKWDKVQGGNTYHYMYRGHIEGASAHAGQGHRKPCATSTLNVNTPSQSGTRQWRS